MKTNEIMQTRVQVAFAKKQMENDNEDLAVAQNKLDELLEARKWALSGARLGC